MQNLQQARELLEKQVGDLDKVSKVYESAAWGYSSKNEFYNCCLSVLTFQDPISLLNTLMNIEDSLGRIRTVGGYTDRLIDIDLLFYADLILEHPRLTLPHPAMADRRFVLEPLAEIAGDLLHPLSGLSIQEMLLHCPDKNAVNPVTSW